ncbi:MAG: RND transporter [Deltaproteobacteria bacterium]|nr:MAG: RND transporter [Deltaproteobacteria bacterium]
MGKKLTELSIKHPKLLLAFALLLTALSLIKVGDIQVDTDPENMLGADEPVRVFHNEVKERFALSDMLVVGVVNEENPDGVFNTETLRKVYELTEGAKLIDGVVVQDLMAPSTVDDILQAGMGSVSFKYLMDEPPKTREEALHIRDRIMANPMLYGTLVSEDGKAVAIYVPIERKDMAHRVSVELKKLVDHEGKGAEEYHITGLPVAEDTFGVEMFQQMAISAPLAGMVVFLLMLFFFQKLVLVISPMMVAMLTVAITMGTLISTGNTVHIMSSMIPIFLMPIAVVDSVHILSVFFDRYQHYRNRAAALREVMNELFMPMFYTSVTTMVGFASLAMTPIPPVQVFGLFVALGVGVAWLFTVLLVPAYILLFIPEKSLDNFGQASGKKGKGEGRSPLAKILRVSGASTQQRAKLYIALTMGVVALSVFGITKIEINDNPVKWFVDDHPIRVADKVLNEHFGGTYGAYLVLEPADSAGSLKGALGEVKQYFNSAAAEAKSPEALLAARDMASFSEDLAAEAEAKGDSDPAPYFKALDEELSKKFEGVEGDNYDLLDELDLMSEGLENIRLSTHIFKDPEVLRYVDDFQKTLAKDPVVGKSNSLADMVKKVYMELLEGNPDEFRIPDTSAAVAQSILSYQSSHDPDDLWHLVTPDYRNLNIWVQLKSGDNRDMEEVVTDVDKYFAANPPPGGLTHKWAGLTYLNTVWQERMVSGMLSSLLGSFLTVLILMALLFRSLLWGVLSMIPLSVTIAFTYGLIGLLGKDYDMPVAVLSSLTLGLSIDFAIHYIERARETVAERGSWYEAAREMAEAPARAISRNAIVIALGFLPLLFANLVPYQTVGLFLAAIMAISGVATLVILPSLIKVLAPFLFKKEMGRFEAK